MGLISGGLDQWGFFDVASGGFFIDFFFFFLRVKWISKQILFLFQHWCMFFSSGCFVEVASGGFFIDFFFFFCERNGFPNKLYFYFNTGVCFSVHSMIKL